MSSLYDRIRDGEFKNPAPYPEIGTPNYREAKRIWNETQSSLESEFFRDALFTELGIPLDHPKADEFWSIVWDLGHSAGLSEVLSYAYDIAKLM